MGYLSGISESDLEDLDAKGLVKVEHMIAAEWKRRKEKYQKGLCPYCSCELDKHGCKFSGEELNVYMESNTEQLEKEHNVEVSNSVQSMTNSLQKKSRQIREELNQIIDNERQEVLKLCCDRIMSEEEFPGTPPDELDLDAIDRVELCRAACRATKQAIWQGIKEEFDKKYWSE